MNIFRLKTIFTGMPGGPGVATMYFRDVATAVPSVRSFWLSSALFIPGDVTIAVDNFGDIIDDADGSLVGNWIQDPVAPFNSGNVGPYAAPAGASVVWATGTIVDGSRVTGRTFIVPTLATAYESNGSLVVGAIDQFTTSAAALLSEQNNSFVIWHRPRAARAASATLKALAAHPGLNSLVTGGRVADRVAVLRSRQG